MSKKLENFVSSIANRFFLPVDIEYKDYFSTPLRIIVITFFLYSLIIAIPPIVDFVKIEKLRLPFIYSVYRDPVFWKRWLPFTNLLLEVLFFLMIGGSVFSEWVAIHSQKVIDEYQSAVEKSKNLEMTEAKEILIEKVNKYNLLLKGITIKNIIPRIYAIYINHHKKSLDFW